MIVIIIIKNWLSALYINKKTVVTVNDIIESSSRQECLNRGFQAVFLPVGQCPGKKVSTERVDHTKNPNDAYRAIVCQSGDTSIWYTPICDCYGWRYNR